MNLLDAIFESDCNAAIVNEWSMVITGDGHCMHLGSIEPMQETLGEVSEMLKEENIECRPMYRW